MSARRRRTTLALLLLLSCACAGCAFAEPVDLRLSSRPSNIAAYLVPETAWDPGLVLKENRSKLQRYAVGRTPVTIGGAKNRRYYYILVNEAGSLRYTIIDPVAGKKNVGMLSF